MKILLLGEYSNVHNTLAQGLRTLGHEVTVASNGDFWKDYPRDIDLSRDYSRWGGAKLAARLTGLLPRLCGYDIVQLINPMFVELKARRVGWLYDFLRRHNRKVVLGAFGMDYYWVSTCCEQKPLRYSDFNIGQQLRTNADALRERADWVGTEKERLNRRIANDCDGIVASLYEYWVCYQPVFPDKCRFIPFPISMADATVAPTQPHRETPKTIRLFIGINKSRSEYKGTDIMLRAAKAVAERHPDDVRLLVAESVPFAQYVEMMQGADVILDQLYSYTPSMNPLEAMKRGIICVGGGEPENYEIIGERELRPIINVEPTFESVVEQLESLVAHKERIPLLQQQSIDYVRRHHDHLKVARQYVDFYTALLST